jgi:hypothetical protein
MFVDAGYSLIPTYTDSFLREAHICDFSSHVWDHHWQTQQGYQNGSCTLGFDGQQFSQALAPKKLDHHYVGWPKAIYIFLLKSNGKA